MALLSLLLWAKAEAAAPAPPVLWTRSLADQGYPAVIRTSGLDGEIALSWPLPSGVAAQGGTVELHLTALTTAGFDAVIEILINGRGAASQALPPGPSRHRLKLRVPPEALAEGQLRVSLRYAAAASGSRCRDARLGGLQLAVDRASALFLSLAAPKTPREALALLPAEIGLAIPHGALSPEAYRDALAIATALVRSGHRLRPRDEAEADLVLSQTAGRAALRRNAIVLPLDRQDVIDTPPRTAFPVDDGQAMALTALGAGMEARDVAAHTEWRFQLPGRKDGRQPEALALTLIRGGDAPGIHHTLHLTIGGTIAASAELQEGRGAPLILAIPPGVRGFADEAVLRFTRRSRSGCVESGAPLPVALSPSSRLLLGPASGQPRQFFEVAEAAVEGLAVYLPADYFENPAASVAFLAALLKDYWQPGTPLAVSAITDTSPAPAHPFLLIAREPPEALSLPLRSDARQAVIETRDRRRIATFDRAAGGFAVLARLGETDGIWIAPPLAGPLPGRLRLEHGDLALFDDSGVAFWLNTEAPRGLSLRYADATGIQHVFGKGWLFGTAGLWCLATLVILIALGRHGFRR